MTLVIYASAAHSRRVKVSGRGLQCLETARRRLWVAGLVFALAFGGVAARLADIAVLQPGATAPRLAAAAPAPETARADVVDRNGVILATSLPTASLFADAGQVPDPVDAALKLATVLPDLDIDATVRALAGGRRFVWLRRGITPQQEYEINRLGIPGVGFRVEQRRYYPLGSLTAHAVGFTDVDGRGLAGIERSMEARLAADAPVTLSLDVRLQEILHDALSDAVDEFRAIGGNGLILDVDTGEVLAMVSLPDFNPYEPGAASDDTRFDRNALGVYEMGSTFKIFTTAMALDSGTTTMAAGYDATRPLRVGRHLIHDFHPERRYLTLPEVFMHSSNIGAAQMALAMGAEQQQAYLARFGFLAPSPIELDEVGAPLVPNPWREINTATISFGHGMAVTPLQTASAVAAVVNGGVLHPPTLLRHDPAAPVEGVRVISERTSAEMRRLLRLVVEAGTGQSAAAEGYLVGGKTGTAEKTRGRSYDADARLSSFIAAFPMNAPKYVVMVMLDEPKGNERTFGFATGGWVAAPAVRRIVEQMGPIMGLPPVDEQAPEILEALYVDIPGRERPPQLVSYSR